MRRLGVIILAKVGDFRNLFTVEKWVDEFFLGHDFVYRSVLVYLLFVTIFKTDAILTLAVYLLFCVFLWLALRHTKIEDETKHLSLRIRELGLITCFVMAIFVYALYGIIISKVPKGWSF